MRAGGTFIGGGAGSLRHAMIRLWSSAALIRGGGCRRDGASAFIAMNAPKRYANPICMVPPNPPHPTRCIRAPLAIVYSLQSYSFAARTFSRTAADRNDAYLRFALRFVGFTFPYVPSGFGKYPGNILCRTAREGRASSRTPTKAYVCRRCSAA